MNSTLCSFINPGEDAVIWEIGENAPNIGVHYVSVLMQIQMVSQSSCESTSLEVQYVAVILQVKIVSHGK